MQQIHIKDLTLNAIIGVLEHERIKQQPIIIDLSLECDLSLAAASDNLNDAVDYAHVCTVIESICTQNEFYLIEKLAQTIINQLLETYNSIRTVDITIYKPQAIRNAKVGIQITQAR